MSFLPAQVNQSFFLVIFDEYLTSRIIQEKCQPYFQISLTFQEKFCSQIEIHSG